MKALSFGEVLWDIYPDSQHIGGAPLNFAAHFVKCGGEAWISTAVGKDLLGQKTVNEIMNFGVNEEYINYSDQETGKCLVTLNNNHVPAYNLLDNVAYDYIKALHIKNKEFDVLYFGTLSLRNENNRDVLKQIIKNKCFKEVFVDMNVRLPYYSNSVAEFVLENATIVKISEEELPEVLSLFDNAKLSIEESARLISREFGNIKLIIITMGDNGSFVYDCINQKTYRRTAIKVETISTVGAGDSFSAAFLAKFLKTSDIENSLQFATKVSGYVVSQKEAIPNYNMNNFK